MIETNYLNMRLGHFKVVEFHIDQVKNCLGLKVVCEKCGESKDAYIKNDKVTLINCSKCHCKIVVIPISYRENGIVNDTISITYSEYRKLIKQYRSLNRGDITKLQYLCKETRISEYTM